MFETLINPKKAEKKPWEMILIGFFYASLSILIADLLFLKNVVFSEHLSILVITFTVMFCIPFMYYNIKLEEKKDESFKRENKLIKEHGKALLAFTFLFVGILIAMVLWFLVLPSGITIKNFEAPIKTYCSINMPYDIDGCMKFASTGVSLSKQSIGFSQGIGRVSTILTNNIYVMLFALLFSFMFGAGAIFILTWNASVIASAIGMLAKTSGLHTAFFRYLTHGILEIVAYFTAALAGGIISVAVIRHDYKSDRFYEILEDSLDLILIAVLILIVAALVEVFVTPALF